MLWEKTEEWLKTFDSRCVLLHHRHFLFDFGDAAVGGGGIFAELLGVVAGDDAIGIASGELNHARLILDVRGPKIFRESGAGFVFGEIAIEIAVVGREDERRIAFDAQIL